MAKLRYDDLTFNFKEFIPWKDIAEASGREDHFDEYLMTYETVGDFIENQVEPFAYVRDLLVQFSGEPPEDLSDLLPDQWLQTQHVHRALLAADDELAPARALELDERTANRAGGLRILQHGQRVVGQRIEIGSRAAQERRHALGLAHHGDGRIDQVAPELEHGAP